MHVNFSKITSFLSITSIFSISHSYFFPLQLVTFQAIDISQKISFDCEEHDFLLYRSKNFWAYLAVP